MEKRVLLIAGGGTLGTYTYKELLAMGYSVDVICLEDYESSDERLRFFKAYATDEYLEEMFAKNHYVSIVNFICYRNADDYKKVYPLLIKNTDQLVFVSSYRVYADEEHPIKETSPRLYDVLTDEAFLNEENYARPKSQCEDFLRNECASDPWTIVRPVISFSDRRMDFYTYSGQKVLDYAQRGEEMVVPAAAKNKTAGLDWAGNSGKLIARLCVNPKAIGECYTISTAPNLTWGEVAEIYEELIGLKVKWGSEEEYLEKNPQIGFMYHYDRKYDRAVDCTKVLNAVGMKKEDFASIREGIQIELEKLKNK